MAEIAANKERLLGLFACGGIVKIDGLREPDHAAAAAAAGADLIGFIFAPARRHVTAAVARSCIAAARENALGRNVLSVGVFVDAAPAEMARIAREAGIDAVQLHGAEPPHTMRQLPVPVLKALRPKPGTSAKDVLTEISRYRSASTPPLGFLVDGYAEGVAGGSGARADWRVASEIAAVCPILLAGGLNPQNVGAAIRQVRPLGVDVSSGVEIDGVKAPEQIEAFIRAARQAFQD